MLTQRQQRLNRLIRAEISEMLLRHLKDPRLSGMITITEVQVAPDFTQAIVYVLVSGTAEERKEKLAGLTSAARHMRGELGRRLRLRHTPELDFRMDVAQERGDRVLDLMDQVRRELHRDE